MYVEQGKAGGHMPQYFSLPCHILAFCLHTAISHNRTVFHATAFESSASFYFFDDKFRALKL